MEPRIIHVKDGAGLAACAERLRASAVIGVDSESNSMYVYRERVCYLQIGAGDEIFLIDTLALDDIDALLPVFADPDIVKVLHGADYDVVCLGRDYGARFAGLFDTMLAAQLLGRDGLGLAALCRDFFDVELDKSLTKHDWGRRPLEEQYVRYLVEDVLYLEGLRDRLTEEMVKADIEEEFRIECERVAGMEWSGKPFDPDGYWKIKGVRDLPEPVRAALKSLWCVREEIAEQEDLPPFKVAHNQALMSAARYSVSSGSTDAGKAFRGGHWRRHGNRIRGAIRDALDGKLETPRPARGERPPRQLQAAQEALRSWRRARAQERDLPPMVVMPNHAMNAILAGGALKLDELAEIPGWGPKRHGLYGAQVVEILQKHLSEL